MPRLRIFSVLASLVLVGAACSSTPGASAPATSEPASSAPTTVVVASPAASGSAAPSICTSQRTGGDSAPGPGALSGNIDSGRILIGLEGAGGSSSGTFAFAIIGSAGIHVVGTGDWTMAHAAWAPAGGIVFDSERADDRHLFHMAEDGTAVSQLTHEFRAAQQSAAFAGSDRIVYDHYSCSEPRDLGLQVASADGSNPIGLTPSHALGDDTSDSQTTISPDGSTVVFVRTIDADASNGGLFQVPIAGGAAKRLTPDTGGISYPRYSPDGKSILFTQVDANGDPALWLIPATGGTARQLTTFGPGKFAFKGAWSPDGSRIVYSYYERGWDHNALHVVAADGTGDTELWVGLHSTAEDPAWGN